MSTHHDDCYATWQVTPPELLVLAGVALWNGLIPSAFTTWAQTYGQAAVSPSAANVLYSSRARAPLDRARSREIWGDRGISRDLRGCIRRGCAAG